MSPSPMQLLIIGLIILVLFGASRLGEVGKGLGDGIRNFKKGISGDDGEDSKADAKQLKETARDGNPSEVAEKKEKV